MRRLFLPFFLLISLFLSLLCGCGTTTLKSAGGETNVTPAMWHVSHNASDLYLLGSFHLLPRGIKWYGEPIEMAFEGADELVVESIDSPEEARRAMMLLEEKALLPEGKSLADYLEPGTVEKLMESADLLGLDRERVSRTQPWFLTILFVYEGMTQSGIQKEYGVDHLFEQAAMRREMKISGLETMSEALNSLASQPLRVQFQRLEESMNKDDQNSVSLAALFRAWAFGDEKAIAKLMREELSAEEYRRVLVERNSRWLPRVEQHLSQPKQTMVVVGAAHLVGKRSLIAMLRSKGYQVTRVQ